MKKLPFLFYVFAAGVFIISCEKQHSEENTRENSDADSVTMEPVDEEDKFVSISFSVDCANEEINALLKDPAIMRMAKDTAVGGTFLHKEEFFPYANPTLEDGVMLWYNLMEIDGKKMLVLAAEPMDLRTAKRRDISPRLLKLTYPNEVFRVDPSTTFTIREEKHTKIHDFNGVASIVSNADVVTRRKNFEGLIAKKKTKHKTRFNKNSGLFFQNNADNEHSKGLLLSLVNQPGVVGIRYYFAYKDDERRNDKIRVVLIGVDSLGRNVVPGIDDLATVNSALIIQKSIPPGPSITKTCP